MGEGEKKKKRKGGKGVTEVESEGEKGVKRSEGERERECGGGGWQRVMRRACGGQRDQWMHRWSETRLTPPRSAAVHRGPARCQICARHRATIGFCRQSVAAC